MIHSVRASRLAVFAALSVLLAGSIIIWVAMHRNLYGTGGQIIPVFEAIWRSVSGGATAYPVTGWASGFVLRPGLIVYAIGYAGLLVMLRQPEIGRETRLRTLLIWAGVIGFPFLLMPHFMSSDVFDYGGYGRLLGVYHVNPYVSSISEFPADPFYGLAFWKATPSVYGPAWTLLSTLFTGVAQVAGGSVVAMLLSFKTAMLLFQITSGAIIWRVLERAGVPDRAFRTALFLFNPLVMIEFAGNGHNEAMMIAFLTAAIALDQRGQWALAALCFTVAAQTKLYCLPMFCLYVAYRCWRADSPAHALRRLASLTLLFVAGSLLLYLPFGWNAATILAPLQGPGNDSMTKSLSDYLLFKTSVDLRNLPVIGLFFRGDRMHDVRRLALLSTLVACVGAAITARSLSRAVTAMAFFALFWCVVGATWFMPWYATAAVAMAVMSRSKSIGATSLVLSLTVFMITLLEGNAFSRDPNLHNLGVTYFQLFIFLPPLAVFAATALWERFGGRKRSDTLLPENR